MPVMIPQTVQPTNHFYNTKEAIQDYGLAFVIGLVFLVMFFLVSALTKDR